MNLLRHTAIVMSMDVDIGIKMRRDYKGDARSKVLDRPSCLEVVGVASWRPLDFSPSISVRCFYNAHPLHRKFRKHGRAGVAVYIFR